MKNNLKRPVGLDALLDNNDHSSNMSQYIIMYGK